jgi:hypothetical protein
MDASRPTSGARERLQLAALVAAAVVGVGLRLWLMAISVGSNDAVAWREFADIAQRHGLAGLFTLRRDYNHPPLMCYFAVLALSASRATGLPFEALFKLLPLGADVLAGVLLYRRWQQRAGRGLLAVAALALSLDSILVTAYHGNTDSLMASLVLLAAVLFDAGRIGWAGFALGAAINVKLVPVLLLPVFLFQCRERRRALTFVGACAIWALPFVPIVLDVPRTFYRQMIGYNSNGHRWGLNALLEPLGGVHELFRRRGRHLVILALCVVGYVGGSRRRWSACELTTLALATFLLLTPGFGVQYTVWVLPVLLAVDLRLGALYGTVAGVFLLAVYTQFWTGTWPAYSLFQGPYAPAPVAWGVVAWVILIGVARRILAGVRPRSA